jgi:uncharacterized protein YdeI (YjbR/CyaY-like superfamily)
VGAPEVRSPIYFETPTAFRAWLRAHHARGTDVWVGFHKRASGRPSLTWPESVDEALCVGWIDGIRRSIDVERYAIRFTPRRRQSTWSAVNIKRAKELIRLGRMQPAGLRAFRARSDEQSAIYSYEQRRTARLAPADERRFKANAKAWAFFTARPPWYRRIAIYWVVSAKRPETRERRLAALIADSARGRTVPPLTRPGRSS